MLQKWLQTSQTSAIPRRMQAQAPYYVKKIKEDFSQKQRKNPHYSLRSYARDMSLHPATLSQVLNGKRELPYRFAQDVARKLRLEARDKEFFLESFIRTRSRLNKIAVSGLDERFMLNESFFKVIAEWEHYAVLELFNLEGFVATEHEIAARLDINLNRAQVVLEHLIEVGLLQRDLSGKVIKIHEDVRTSEDIESQALQTSHEDSLKIAAEKLRSVQVDLRDFSAEIMAVDLKKLPELKELIREFRQKINAYSKSGKKSHVYQLAIQFYPLTKIKGESKKK